DRVGQAVELGLVEVAAIRQYAELRRGGVVQRAGGGPVDAAVPADAELLERVAVELHDLDVHPHHRPHADRVAAAEVADARVGLAHLLDAVPVGLADVLPGHHDVAADDGHPRVASRSKHRLQYARGLAEVVTDDGHRDVALAAVLEPQVQRGVARLAGDDHQLASAERLDFEQLAAADRDAAQRDIDGVYHHLAAVQGQFRRQWSLAGPDVRERCGAG